MPMLEVRDLGKRFGGLQAIDQLGMRVEEGEFHGVIGPNGAGKTTLLNLITGYLRPSSGSILLDGKPITGERPFRICRMGVARTFQVVRPFGEMSVLDNVMTGALFSRAARPTLPEAQSAARRALELTRLWPKQAMAADALTLGEKKRLELARALATRPRLLLLDEVMGGLASSDVDDMVDVVRDVHRTGSTIVMIAHLVEVIIALAQRVTVLNFGRKLFDGEPRAVFERPEVVDAYLGRKLEMAP
jgi:branched-chain amino acid transport system ATP-binding protein